MLLQISVIPLWLKIHITEFRWYSGLASEHGASSSIPSIAEPCPFWICNSEKGALTTQRSTHTGSDPEVLGTEQRGRWLGGWPCTIRARLKGLCPPAGSSDPWVLHSQPQEPPSTHQPELLAHPHTLPGSALREKGRAGHLIPPLCLSSDLLLWIIWHSSCKEQILLHICKKDFTSLMYGLSQQGRKQSPFWLLYYLCSALSIDKYLHEWIML